MTLGQDVFRGINNALSFLNLFVGNWKCNGTVESVKELVKDLNAGKCHLLFC